MPRVTSKICEHCIGSITSLLQFARLALISCLEIEFAAPLLYSSTRL